VCPQSPKALTRARTLCATVLRPLAARPLPQRRSMLAMATSFIGGSRLRQCARLLGAFQRKAAAARIANPQGIRRLKAEHATKIDLFKSLDPVDDARCCNIR